MEASTLPDSIYGPAVDGVVFSEPPLSALAKGQSSNVPLLVGFTKDEGRWWLVDVPVLQEPESWMRGSPSPRPGPESRGDAHVEPRTT